MFQCRISHQHLCCHSFSPYGSCERRLAWRNWRDAVRQIKAVVSAPLVRGKSGRLMAKDSLRRGIPNEKFSVFVSGNKPFMHAVEHALEHERLGFKSFPGMK